MSDKEHVLFLCLFLNTSLLLQGANALERNITSANHPRQSPITLKYEVEGGGAGQCGIDTIVNSENLHAASLLAGTE